MSDLFGGTLPITLDAQVKEIEREIALRRRVYPRLTEAGKLSQAARPSGRLPSWRPWWRRCEGWGTGDA